MTSLSLIRTWSFAALVAVVSGMGLSARAEDAQANGGASLQIRNAGATAPSAPAVTAQTGAVRSRTASATDAPAAPEPTADEVARFEQAKAAMAVARVRVVRGSLFSAGEAPVSESADEHTRAAPVMSYTSVTPMEPKKFRKHDIVTVVVREDSNNTSTAKGNSERKQDFDFELQQFLKFSLANLAVSNSSNPSQLPAVKFKFDNNRQNSADQERTDSTSLRISATVVDVKPNGTLVIEATKQITMDKEVQHMTLSGVCRAEDVTVDNTLLSTQLADLKLEKSTTGEVRDGTKRGWLNSLIDKFNPF